MMLESFQHAENSFVTLTYSDAKLPTNGSLYPEHLKGWLKRLRERIAPQRIRYFAVGEYGDRTERPHYHAALFGFMPCTGGVLSRRGECPCSSCTLVRESWGFGHVMVAELSFKSAAYIAGYVVKKMTRMQDTRLNGRWPEFARMSLKPGIGADAMWDVASAVMQNQLEKKTDFDVPVDLRHGSKKFPLGRYLRRVLRARVGLPEGAPPHVLEALRSGLLPVFGAVEAAAPKLHGPTKRLLVQQEFEKMNEQYGRNVAAKGRKRGTL